MLFYAASIVATGVLNARDSFTIPVAAPIINNILVLAVLAVFWLMRGASPPHSDLSTGESAVLAGGTTLAVVAFTSIPVVSLLRSGFRFRPRLDIKHPEVRALAHAGAWAALFILRQVSYFF